MVAPSPLSGFSRITLAAPTTRADVAVPNSVPIAAFMSALLRQIGQDPGASVAGNVGWRLLRFDGRHVDLARSMDANEVRDGDVLVLAPMQTVIEDPLFDDVVELVGQHAVGERWGARQRRLTAAITGSLAALIALAALARMPRHGYLQAGICVAAAVVLLLAGFALSRAAGDLAAGGITASLAGPYAAVGAALFHTEGWDHDRLLLASGALLLVAAVLPALVGGFEAVAGFYALLAIFGAAGGLLALQHHAGTERAAAVIAPLALASTTIMPALALRFARLPRPQLALTATDLAELPGEVDQATTTERVANARGLLSGLTAGAMAVTAIGAIVLVQTENDWSRALAGVLVLLMLLRTRLYAARAPVAVGVVAAAVAAAGIAGTALTGAGAKPPVILALVAAGIGLAALAVGATAGRWDPSPRQRRLVDIVETLALVAVAPLVLGAWDVYHKIFGLGH